MQEQILTQTAEAAIQRTSIKRNNNPVKQQQCIIQNAKMYSSQNKAKLTGLLAKRTIAANFTWAASCKPGSNVDFPSMRKRHARMALPPKQIPMPIANKAIETSSKGTITTKTVGCTWAILFCILARIDQRIYTKYFEHKNNKTLENYSCK